MIWVKNLHLKKKVQKKRRLWKHEIVYKILKNEEKLTSLELKEKMNLNTISTANNFLNKLVYRGKAVRLPNPNKNRYKNFKAL